MGMGDGKGRLFFPRAKRRIKALEMAIIERTPRREARLTEETTKHPPHVERMLTERDELADRTLKLGAFFDTDTFSGLRGIEKDLLHAQYQAMSGYHTILNARISIATGATELVKL